MRRKILLKNEIYNFSGAEMSYSVIGRGKPIILIHGAMSHDPWCGMEISLAK